jgi:hypothetical protein
VQVHVAQHAKAAGSHTTDEADGESPNSGVLRGSTCTAVTSETDAHAAGAAIKNEALTSFCLGTQREQELDELLFVSR